MSYLAIIESTFIGFQGDKDPNQGLQNATNSIKSFPAWENLGCRLWVAETHNNHKNSQKIKCVN